MPLIPEYYNDYEVTYPLDKAVFGFLMEKKEFIPDYTGCEGAYDSTVWACIFASIIAVALFLNILMKIRYYLILLFRT